MMNILRILKTIGMCLACAIFVGCTYASQGLDPHIDRGARTTETADIYGDIAKKIVYPEQNWAPEDSLWFYNTSQGSNLMDYNIFLHLERDDSTAQSLKLFHSDSNMVTYRFLPQRNTSGNTDGLPVGWVKDSYEGKDYIGFTCAACHTTQVNYNNEDKGISVGIRIDGGPSMADIQTMFQKLQEALWKSLPENDQDKFDRLAINVLGPDASEPEKLQFRGELDTQHKKIETLNNKDDPKVGQTDPNYERKNGHYGYGRLDAFGRIFNRIESVRSPSSKGQYHPANAPVSYPFLWDTPHHDFVQWNGIAGNTGEGGLGPLGRNASEVIGVFATVHAGTQEPWLISKLLGFGNYSSSLRKWNQVGLERKIKHLWSPSWEQLSEKGVLPELNEDLVKRGKQVFIKYKCESCHESIIRKDSGRRVISQFSSVEMIGTDKGMAQNAINYCSRNEFPPVPKGEWCSDDRWEIQEGKKGADAITHLTGEVLANGALWDVPLLIVSWASNPWRSLIPFMTTEADKHVDFEVVNENTLNVYKGRPLNGMWATAPYLHNGSVPSLYELFLPSSCKNKEGSQLEEGITCRSKTFTVGSRELDIVNVGFKQLDNLKKTYPKLEFDTSLLGNSNEGHEYAAGVTPIIKTDENGKAIPRPAAKPGSNPMDKFEIEYLEPINHDERMALIEYLKSL